MSDLCYTLDDLHEAEKALARHHAAIDAGEPIGELVRAKPGCKRKCATCYFSCALTVGCVARIREGLVAQARQARPSWQLLHAGRSYIATAGTA